MSRHELRGTSPHYAALATAGVLAFDSAAILWDQTNKLSGVFAALVFAGFAANAVGLGFYAEKRKNEQLADAPDEKPVKFFNTYRIGNVGAVVCLAALAGTLAYKAARGDDAVQSTRDAITLGAMAGLHLLTAVASYFVQRGTSLYENTRDDGYVLHKDVLSGGDSGGDDPELGSGGFCCWKPCG